MSERLTFSFNLLGIHRIRIFESQKIFNFQNEKWKILSNFDIFGVLYAIILVYNEYLLNWMNFKVIYLQIFRIDVEAPIRRRLVKSPTKKTKRQTRRKTPGTLRTALRVSAEVFKEFFILNIFQFKCNKNRKKCKVFRIIF